MKPVPRPRVPGAALWVRAALRRPGRALLVVAGLVAMSTATVAALVAADSLESLFVRDVEAQWGDVDVVVASPRDAVFDESTGRAAAIEGAGPGGRWANRLLLDAVVSGAPGRREPRARVLGVSAEERSFGRPLTGDGQVDPVFLEPDEVIVNRRLAERLQADVGDPLEVVLAVPELVEREIDGAETRFDPHVETWAVTVAGIADDAGVADFGRTPNVLARLDAVQRVALLEGKVSALHVAAPAPGRDAAEEVTRAFEATARMFGLRAAEAKEDALDVAREEGGLFRGILVTLALLVVLAAAVVAGNLLVLLGQERAAEVAALRAVGARTATVRRLLTAEGTAYAAVAAVLGAVAAFALADLLAGALADHFAGINAGRGREQVELALTARPATVATGLVLVLGVGLLTARAAARRVAALPLDEVLRGAPALLGGPGSSERRQRWTLLAGVLVLGMGLTAEAGGDLLRFLGASLLLVAWWLRARSAAPDADARRRTDERAALAGLAWNLGAPAVLGDFGQGVQSSFGLLALAGAGAVACATVLAAGRMPAIMRVVRLYLPGRRTQAPLRTAGSYAGANPSRTGTVVGTVAGVLFMVAALAVLGSATAIGSARQGGGYAVVGTAPVQVDVEQLRSTRGVARVDAMPHTDVPETAFATRDEDDEEATVPYPVRAIRTDGAFASAQRFTVVASLPGYEDGVRALEAVVDGAGVVVDRYARPEGAQPGDEVVIDLGAGPSTHRLLAVVDTFVLGGVLMGPQAYDELFPDRGPTFVLASGRGDVRPEDLATELAGAAGARGLVVDTIEEAADEVVRVNRTFTDVFALVLQLGLAVALVAVAVLVARSARERRRALGVLRATGFRRRDVLVLLLGEPLLQAAVGLLIGVGVGLGSLWLLFRRGFADLAFVVGWSRLGATAAAVLVLVALACAAPSVRAARADVAAALRDLG